MVGVLNIHFCSLSSSLQYVCFAHVDIAMSINFPCVVRVLLCFEPSCRPGYMLLSLFQHVCVLLFFVLFFKIIANFFSGACVFSCFFVTNVGLLAFFGSISFHLSAATVCFSETWLYLCRLPPSPCLLFDGLMEEWIQLEERVENPASSYYHLFITLPVSLAPSFRFLCCPPLLLFNRCIFSVGY